MKKIEVIKELCISCGACLAIDEEHFDFNDDGIAIVKHHENIDSKSLLEAIDACPTDAIRFECPNNCCK